MKITKEHIEILKSAKNNKLVERTYTAVLTLKAQGRTHKQIADTLNISTSYVNHIITQTRKAAKLTN
ncbi:helix-turn-helix domain-containing protein [Enterobacter roggenkampii]|uniref:helix-turn-helix domain-containing protein n=1 Tax=Enterobacter roggenkampii TaxID=1812935 RepID=UPI00201959DA|nr:helix-turn-helix domain-containing protein [Enterobacter roggenkampii]UQQ40215.1 helix-turn-helix domain-containing protein [Enterobacter roggenkampii]